MFKFCNEIKRMHLKARKKKRQFSLALHLEHYCGEKKEKKPVCTRENNQQIDNGKELQSWHNSKHIFKEVDMG